MATDFQTVAQQFVDYYYKTFDADRGALAALYRPQSMLTFESNATQGGDAIIEKLKGLPFQKVEHRVDTVDAQPSSPDGGVLVLVTGAILTDEESKPLTYAQTFQLVKDGESYFVFNDVFKLVYAGA
ncbi:MAG: Nuclear transport factor 2 [Alyxoria varia]|nr:MAG: Nuclear transport factor 2 [Alyxoria varia]